MREQPLLTGIITVTMIKELSNCGFAKQLMIKSRYHDESVVLHLLYSGCYDERVF